MGTYVLCEVHILAIVKAIAINLKAEKRYYNRFIINC